jgi:hypothetical protein
MAQLFAGTGGPLNWVIKTAEHILLNQSCLLHIVPIKKAQLYYSKSYTNRIIPYRNLRLPIVPILQEVLYHKQLPLRYKYHFRYTKQGSGWPANALEQEEL